MSTTKCAAHLLLLQLGGPAVQFDPNGPGAGKSTLSRFIRVATGQPCGCSVRILVRCAGIFHPSRFCADPFSRGWEKVYPLTGPFLDWRKLGHMNLVSRCSHLPVLLLHNLDQKWAAGEVGRALQEVAELESAMRGEGHPVTNAALRDGDLGRLLGNYHPDEYIVLNWCEEMPGMTHSESLVALALEERRFSYTGSPPDVLALSWNKRKVKNLLDQHGLATPRWRVYESPRPDGWDCFPAIVKPAQEHCSLGVTPEAVVLNPAELQERVAYVLERFDQPALVEDFIDGREFHVSLWGNGEVQMLPPAEMDFTAFEDLRERLCTYDSKFAPGSIHYKNIQLRLPAPLTEKEYDLLEQTVFQAYFLIGCRDYARIDIRLRDGIFYVLDVNPNADISSGASMACAAEVAGYSYGAMASQLVNIAAQRHPVFGPRQG